MRLWPWLLAGTAGVIVLGMWRQQQNQSPLDPSPGGWLGSWIDLGATMQGLTGSTMTTSPGGRAALVQREGRVNTVYLDEGGKPTGGIGHLMTKADMANYNVGDSIDEQTIDDWFNSDVAKAENTVLHYVSVPLTQNQFDALVSATFNIGPKLFHNFDSNTDTHVLTYLNMGEYQLAAEALKQWDHVSQGGVMVVSAGLLKRRTAEAVQFMEA